MKKNSRSKSGPRLFLSCEHAGNEIPKRYQKLFEKNQGVLQTHRGFDPGAFAVATKLAKLSKTKLYYTKISRLIVDMNRSPESPTALSRWTKSLEPKEQSRIFTDIYWPYRTKVIGAVETAIKQQKLTSKTNPQPIVHIGLHSFSPYLDESRRTCDIGILYDPKNKLESNVAKLLKAQLERFFPSMGVFLNFPYRGDADGLTTDLRKKYRAGLYAGIEIELNQVLLKKMTKQETLNFFCLNLSVCLSSVLTDLS